MQRKTTSTKHASELDMMLLRNGWSRFDADRAAARIEAGREGEKRARQRLSAVMAALLGTIRQAQGIRTATR